MKNIKHYSTTYKYGGDLFLSAYTKLCPMTCDFWFQFCIRRNTTGNQTPQVTGKGYIFPIPRSKHIRQRRMCYVHAFVQHCFHGLSILPLASREHKPLSCPAQPMYPVSILYKFIAGRYRPVRVADGPITARYRFIKNPSWVKHLQCKRVT